MRRAQRGRGPRRDLGLWIVLALGLFALPAGADYLEVRRSATIKAEPHGEALILERVAPPTELAIEPVPGGTNDQINGYYLVRRPGGGTGWIYRTLGRRHPGDLSSTSAQSSLEVHFIDVGQGDCTLLVCPGGDRILVDCGSSGGADLDAARAYLLAQLDGAAPRLDALFITHADRDHYNMIPDMLAGIEIGHVYTSGEPGEHAENGVDVWLNAIPAFRRTVLQRDFFDPFDRPSTAVPAGGADLWVLASNTEATHSGGNFERNAKSIVLKVTFGQVDFLLTGDATFGTEETIADRYPHDWLDVEVLKVGHHGSSTTSTAQEFVDLVQPELAVASASATNGFGHPRREVLERLEPYTEAAAAHTVRWGWYDGGSRLADRTGYEEAIYNTASSGNVVVETDGVAFDLRTEF